MATFSDMDSFASIQADRSSALSYSKYCYRKNETAAWNYQLEVVVNSPKKSDTVYKARTVKLDKFYAICDSELTLLKSEIALQASFFLLHIQAL